MHADRPRARSSSSLDIVQYRYSTTMHEDGWKWISSACMQSAECRRTTLICRTS